MNRPLRALLFGIELTLVAIVVALTSSGGTPALVIAVIGLLTSTYGWIEPSKAPGTASTGDERRG